MVLFWDQATEEISISRKRKPPCTFFFICIRFGSKKIRFVIAQSFELFAQRFEQGTALSDLAKKKLKIILTLPTFNFIDST